MTDRNKGKERDPKETVAPDFVKRHDPVRRFLEDCAKELVFDTFAPAYLEKEGLSRIMTEVPVPLRPKDVVEFHSKKGLPVLCIAENMARIMGANPGFPYVENYKAYLNKYFNFKLVDALVKEGRDEAEKGDFTAAVIHFRAALILDPGNLHAMYSYARGCRELYLGGEEPDYVGSFKSESTEYFELTTVIHPSFSQSYYFLGYAYLNLGLYIKASLTFETFLKLSKNKEDKKEIRQRLTQLSDPVTIEGGCNHILAGRFQAGLQVLEPYKDSSFRTWWPLHYYLGVGYGRTDEPEKAVGAFQRALELNPSHRESMEELAILYQDGGDLEKAEKYRKKALLV